MIKPCPKCGSVERSKRGECSHCKKAYNGAYYKNHHIELAAARGKRNFLNPGKAKAVMDAWREKNPDKVREFRGRQYAKSREKGNPAAAKWRAENPEKIKESRSRYYANNKEKIRAAHNSWRTENPEKAKAATMRWATENPEKRKAINHKRRSRVKKCGGSFAATDICALLKHQRGKCVVCRGDISKIYHIDHVMPLALGGSNNKENIQLLCPFCNLSKKDRHPITFMQSRGFLL